MPREHGRLRVSINQDDDFTNLSEPQQWLYVRLLARPDINQAGVLPLSLRKWARMSSHATTDTVKASAEALSVRHYLVLDFDTEEALVRTFIRNDDVWKQPHVLMAACVSAMGVESKTIREALATEIAKIRADALTPLKEATRKRLEPKLDEALRVLAPGGPKDPAPNPTPNPCGNPSTGTLPEPFDEGLTEPKTEPPGEGEGEGAPWVSSTYKPTTADADEDEDDFEPAPPGQGDLDLGTLPEQRKSGKPKPKVDTEPLFEAFWKLWPRKEAKNPARKKFALLIAKGESASVIIAAAEAQATRWKREQKDPQYCPYASTWLNQRRFEDELPKPGLRVVSDSPWAVHDYPESPFARDIGWAR